MAILCEWWSAATTADHSGHIPDNNTNFTRHSYKVMTMSMIIQYGRRDYQGLGFLELNLHENMVVLVKLEMLAEWSQTLPTSF